MSYHKKHNILGDYCWDCRKRTEAEIPGWPKSSKDDGPKDMNLVPTIVVWADGTEDVSRECGVCTTSPCSKPVHKEEYAEVNKTNELR